ncbi:MAG: glycine cleavage system aminomethyltransferase GcvT [Acidimicrobiia bacterium]|nr:glycine cleavage system aminomethyltransferase GcvT [Acidimicrobiia bacterium]
MTDEMPPPPAALQRTHLHDWHVENGGRMVDFAGWELPVFYEAGALAEHHATRDSVGLFDIDHMGQIQIAGDRALATVDRLVTSDMAGLAVGSARYGLLCNDDGGVIDDVIVYRLATADFLVVVNAANRSADFEWMCSHGDDAEIIDRSDELSMMAVQGPNAVALVDAAAGGGVAELERFTSSRIELFDTTAIVGRTGYTGEDGVELYVDGGVVDVWTGLLETAAGHDIAAMAVGLSARDSLRFEPGYPLYGHELATDITPLEARLGWAVDFEGADFIGRDALVAQKEAGITRRLETIVLHDKGVPREGSPVLAEDGAELGMVVSGMFAPTADVFAANVFLPRTHGAVGTPVVVDVRGRHKAASVAQRPLYRAD